LGWSLWMYMAVGALGGLVVVVGVLHFLGKFD
jgi:hypothetical protein